MILVSLSVLLSSCKINSGVFEIGNSSFELWLCNEFHMFFIQINTPFIVNDFVKLSLCHNIMCVSCKRPMKIVPNAKITIIIMLWIQTKNKKSYTNKRKARQKDNLDCTRPTKHTKYIVKIHHNSMQIFTDIQTHTHTRERKHIFFH